MGRQTYQGDYLPAPIAGLPMAYEKWTDYNAKGQVTTDTISIQRPTQTDKMVSTYTYGSGTGYALGQALSVAVNIYRNEVFQHTAATTNTYAWYDGAVQATKAIQGSEVSWYKVAEVSGLSGNSALMNGRQLLPPSSSLPRAPPARL